MPSSESLRFVRVNYDDSRELPWVVVWGENHVYAWFRTRDAALDQASELRGICDVFHEWSADIT